jgi:hypothetical protein
MGKKIRSRLGKGLLILAGLWLAQLLLFRFAPLPITPHLLAQRAGGHKVEQTWVPLERISDEMIRAVIAAEDNRFCSHWGIDWEAMKLVWQEARDGHRIRGGSTISMQTTKNAYLWLSRSKLRKAIEVTLVPSVDRVWGKKRVMEVYLNLAEFGPCSDALPRTGFATRGGASCSQGLVCLSTVPLHPSTGTPHREAGGGTRHARGLCAVGRLTGRAPLHRKV